MGPTNIALVKLFRADQQLRAAQQRLDSTTRSVRIQERRVNDTAEKLRSAQQRLREQQSQAAQLELDLKSRDEHIEKLRRQQQDTRSNREYQAFLVEINTAKVDRGKVEDQTIKAMEAVEQEQAHVKELQTMLETEQAKLADLKQEISGKTTELQADVERLQPMRDEAASAVSVKARHLFERLSERYEGEAMAALAKPNSRREEYVCTACNMSLVPDIYNRLHARDEPVLCPSCQRLLYIPADLPVETAVHVKKTPKPRGQAESTSGVQAET
jgi:uncharacterized protein